MRHFCNLCGITSLNNRPTCYKHPANRSYIDLISTNCPKYFQNITVIETGLSYFHKMVVTTIKTSVIVNLKLYTIEITRILQKNFLEKI